MSPRRWPCSYARWPTWLRAGSCARPRPAWLRLASGRRPRRA
jgi:hypothetical protein